MEKRNFDLGVILSITTGIVLVYPNAMREMGKLCVFLFGGPDDTETLEGLPHTFLAAAQAAKPELIKQYPWLEHEALDYIGDESDCDEYVNELRAKYGDSLPIQHVGGGVAALKEFINGGSR